MHDESTALAHSCVHVLGTPTSCMMPQMYLMHWVMASAVPDTVTARSVELGSISLATWMDAPVDCTQHTHNNK